jgi:hypothetical protein
MAFGPNPICTAQMAELDGKSLLMQWSVLKLPE